MVQRTEFLEQLFRDLDGRDALQARAQKDRDQLGILERVRAVGREPFARTLAVRQIFDAGAHRRERYSGLDSDTREKARGESSKFQAPSTREYSNSNLQSKNAFRFRAVRYWSLMT